MARRNENKVFAESIIKHLVKSVDEKRLTEVMTMLPQGTILFLLGEFTPKEVGESFDEGCYKDKNAIITSVDIMSATYGIEYTYTEKKFFASEEEAKKYSEKGDYDYNHYSSTRSESKGYVYEASWSRRTSDCVSWPI